MANNIQDPQYYQLASFGAFGFRKITSTYTTIAGEDYRVVYALTAATLSVTSGLGDDLVAVDVAAGAVIYGVFSAVSVSTGTVIAYLG